MIIIKTYETNQDKRGFIAYNVDNHAQSEFIPFQFGMSDYEQQKNVAALLIRGMINAPLETTQLCSAKISNGYAFTY